MEITVINGSPRRDGNTAALCDSFIDGARAILPDLAVYPVNVYDHPLTGCRSCFACKDERHPSYGRCALGDSLREVLPRITRSDGLVIAAPVYLGSLPAQLKGLLERLLFPLTTYERGYRTLTHRRIPVQTLYSMNADREQAAQAGFTAALAAVDGFIGHVFGTPHRLIAYDTYQFKDYAKYRVEVFDEVHKAAIRRTQFPRDLQAAYEAGMEMATALRTVPDPTASTPCPRPTDRVQKIIPYDGTHHTV